MNSVSEDGDDYQDDADQAESEPAAPKEDSDEELDEDAPPKVTFIPLPKLRDAGGIEYVDHRLHQNTLEFLKDLKANNRRPWLKCEFIPPPSLKTPKFY